MSNDMTILVLFITVFWILGIISPIINAEFSQTVVDNDLEGFMTIQEKSALQDQEQTGFWNSLLSGTSSIGTVIRIIINIFTVAFWTFGIPWTINLYVLAPIRVIFLILIYRQLRSGGG